MDSTGVVAVDSKGNVSTSKKAISSSDFVELRRYGKIIDRYFNLDALIGHNRAATRGIVTDDNAHPFRHGNITLVHNGSLQSTYDLPDGNKFQVDSEAIAYALSKMSPEEVIPLLNGAFSLVWYDSDKEEIFFVRNDKRPMNLIECKDTKTILFGSEMGMITWLANRNGIKIERSWSLKEGNLMSFHLPSGKLEPRTTKVKLKNPAPVVSYLPPARPNVPLEEIGLKGAKTVNVYAWKYSKYSVGSDYGTISGFLEDDATVEVLIQGMHKSEVSTKEGDFITGTYKASVLRAEKGGNGSVVVTANRGRLICADTDDMDEEPKKGSKKNSNRKIKEYVAGPGGALIQTGKWLNLTREGCLQCKEPISIDDHELVEWTHDERPICPDCIEAFSDISMSGKVN